MATDKPPPRYQILDADTGRPVDLAAAFNYPQDAPKLQFHVDSVSPSPLDTSKDGAATTVASKIADPVAFDKVDSILSSLMEDERSYPFLEPVDHVALGLHDYLKVVKTPMDLGTVKKRLVEDRFYDLPSSTRTFRYINGQRVLDDVLLVFDNCMKYNQDGSQIFQFAAQLKASFRTKWSREVANLGLGTATTTTSTRSQSRRQSRSRKSVCVGAVVDFFVAHKWDETCQLWLVVSNDKLSAIKRQDRNMPIPDDIETMECVVPLHDKGVILYRVACVAEGRTKKMQSAEPEESYQRESIIFLARFQALVRLAYELRSQALKAAYQRITVLELIAKVSFQCIESDLFPRGVSYTGFYSDNADFFCEELDKLSPGLKSTLNFAKALRQVAPRTLNVLLQSLPNSKVLRITDTRRSVTDEANQEVQRASRESLMLPPPRPLELYMNQKAIKPYPELSKEELVGLCIKIDENGEAEKALVLRYRPRTSKHLLRFEVDERQVWTDLDKVRGWRVVNSSSAGQSQNLPVEQQIVALKNLADLNNFEVPSHLLSEIVSVFLFFKTFRDKLDIDMPLFSFEELCTAILTKSVSEYEDGDLKDAPRTPRLLMRIHIALLEVYIRTSAFEQAQLAAMDKSHAQKAATKRLHDDVIGEWAFNQVVHTDETLSLFHETSEDWQHLLSESGAASPDGKVTLSCLRDPGWRATPPEFLASLFHFYSCTLQWDPGFAPRLSGVSMNLYALYSLVHSCGGLKDVKEADWRSIVDLLHLSYDGEDELRSTVNALQALYSRYLIDYEKHCQSRTSKGLNPGLDLCVWPNVLRKGAVFSKPEKKAAQSGSVKREAVAKSKGALTAFDRLVATQRKALKDAGRDMDEAELVKLCEGLWSNMSDSEKDYYETLATKSSGDSSSPTKANETSSTNAATKVTSSGVKGFAEKNLSFNALNELTWQELLIETLKRIDPTFSDKRAEIVPAGAAPFQRRERRGRPRKETKIEPSEDGFDVGEYDLAEEEEKEANLWSSILGEGKLMKAEKVEDQVKSVKNKTGKSIIDHAKRLVEALISHPLYAHYAEPTTRLKNYTNVVKTPMDLEIVMKRLLGGYYSTSDTTFALDIFARDVDLIWTNACVFFKNTSTPYEDAVHLRGIFHERLEHLRKLHEQTEIEQVEYDVKEFKRVVMEMDEKHARAEYTKLSKKWEMRIEPVQKSYSYGDPASANLKKKFARIAMKHLFSDLRSEPFREPVDAVALGLTDYHDVIKRPMDLGTVRKNLKQGFYDAPAASDLVTPRFVQDVRLVFSNCRIYNERGSEISKAASQLENSFLHLLEQHSRETAAEDRAKASAKKQAAAPAIMGSGKESASSVPPRTPQRPSTTPGSNPTATPGSTGVATANRKISPAPESSAMPLVHGSTPSGVTPHAKGTPSSVAQSSAGLVNATDVRFVDSCVQLMDVLLSAPGVQYIRTNMNGQPIPLGDALNVLRMKLLNGGYNLHDNEVGNGFAFELRQLVMRTSGMTIPGSVPWNTLEAIRVLFEKEYHKRLGYVATSKWTFVGEEFMWLDNSSGGQPLPRRGVIKEYYGPPKYNPAQMSRPADFDHLCCHVEGYNMLLSLNFWTQGTVRRLGPNGIGNFANFYGKNWAFMKDEDAVRQLMQNVQQPTPQNHVAQQNVAKPSVPSPTPASVPLSQPAAPKPAGVASPPSTKRASPQVEAEDPKPVVVSSLPAIPTSEMKADGPFEEPGDVLKGGKVPTLSTYFWDDAMKKLDDKTKSEHIATLLCQHDYADIEPECKLFILEKICTAISDLYKSKLAIAKEMGLRAPRMIEDSPREELPKSPIKKRKPVPVAPATQSTKRLRRSSPRTPTPPPPAQSTRSGRKSTQPQRFNYRQFGETETVKTRVVYRVGDPVEVFSKENSRWIPGEVVKASRSSYAVKVNGKQRSIPKGEAGDLLRKYQADVPDLPLDLGDFVVLALGKIITSDSRVAGSKLYHSHRYIFPVGFKSKRRYPSVKDPKEKVWYTSEIQQGSSGPVFIVTHEGGSPSFSSTATSRVWSEVLDALNEARVKAGLPRGGKLISGPTQYGFTNEKLQQCIEKLGGVQRCKKYIMLKDKENPRRTPGKDVSDGALSESDADTDDDEELEEESAAEIIVTNSGDGYLPPKMINDTKRRKLEEDILALEKTSQSSVLTKRAMSRYLRKPNKQAEIELLRDASSLDGVAGGTAHPDLMDVDETEKKPTGELQITHDQALQCLRAITSNPAFADLCQPIDSKQKGMEHYLKVVPEPMDFKTVLVNLEAGSYVKDGLITRELLQLLELVISNCCVYNADGSQLQQVAVDCERELNSLLELDQTRFAIKGRESAQRRLKLTELLMDLTARLLKDKRGSSLCKKGEFGFQEVMRGLENGRYISAASRGNSQVFSVRNAQAMQMLAGFALDVRMIFSKGLRGVDGDDSSRFDELSELEAFFEEEYAKALSSIEVAIQRKHWLGEKIFVYDEEIEDVIVATITSIKESRGTLVFVLADEHDRFEVDLHADATVGEDDVEEDVLLLGRDWVFTSDLDKVVQFMQQRSLKTVGDRTLASWRDDLRLSSHARRSHKEKVLKSSSRKVVEMKKIPVAEAEPMALLSRPTDREVESRIETFMQQERVKHLCDEHAEEEYEAVKPEKVVRPKPPVEVPGENPNYSIHTTLEIKVSRRNLGNTLPFQFALDRDTNRARVVSQTVQSGGGDTAFGKVEVGDLLMEVNGHDAKFSRQAGLDQAVNSMVQAGSNSRELVLTFRGQRDLYIGRLCTLNRIPIDPNGLYEAVEAYGGFQSIVENMWWQKVRVHMGLSFATSSGHQLRKAYESYFGDLTDSHSKTVGGQVNGIRQDQKAEVESDSSEEDEAQDESRNIRPLKDAVVVPRALHESGPCRLEPLGRDRHFNLYWHLNVSLRPQDMLARALLFVELTPSGLEEFKRVNPGLKASEHSWLKFSSRAEIDTLLTRLDKSIDVEARLWENLTERYAALVSAMRGAGTEFCELPAFVPGNELKFFKEVTQGPSSTARIQLSSSPVVFGGAAFVSAVQNDSSAGDAASASLSREERNLLQKGDVIIRIGSRLCHSEGLEKTVELLQNEVDKASFSVLVYRPKTEAFCQAQALMDTSVDRNAPAVMLNPMRICPAVDQSFFHIVSTLESKLWDLGSADPRILRVLKEWRWLHGWGDWQWPRWREKWQELIMDLATGNGSTPSGCELSKFELAIAALKTICRNFVSTMPPVHPDCYREGRYRLDYTYESLISETMGDDATSKGLKLSQVLTGLPVEGDWLRELDRAKTYSNLSLLATWLYTESAARFSSAIYVANRSETRLLDFQRLKASIQAKLRKERLDDINSWMILFGYQEKFRQLLKAEVKRGKAVKALLSSIVGRIAGEEVEPVDDAEETSSVTSEKSNVVEKKRVRVRTPFEVFVAETKEALVKKGEAYDYRQVTSQCSSVWREMKAEEKKKYERTESQEAAEEERKAASVSKAAKTEEESDTVVNLTEREMDEIRQMADEDTRFFPKKRGPGRPRKSPFATPLPRKPVSEEDIQRRKRRRLAMLQRFDITPPKSNRRQSSVAPWKKFIGVDEIRNRYKSELVLKSGETQLIGRYDTAVEAALAHDAAARHHYPLIKAELLCNFPYKNTMQVLQGWLPDTPLYAMPVSAPRPKPRAPPKSTSSAVPIRMSRDRASLPPDMTCPICYKKFKSSGGLVYHMQIKVCEKRIERSDASLQALRQKNLEKQMMS